MGATIAPRAVVVSRRTELDELLARHGTRGQAAFFLRTRGRDLEEVEVLGSFLDPSIVHPNPTEATNLEPLLINTEGSWSDRPEAASDRVICTMPALLMPCGT